MKSSNVRLFGVYAMIIIIVTMLFAMGACSSRSGRLNKAKLENVIVYKSDIAQDDHWIYFVTYDTTGYTVKVREYRAYAGDVYEHSDSTVVVVKAMPTSDKATFTSIPIQ